MINDLNKDSTYTIHTYTQNNLLNAPIKSKLSIDTQDSLLRYSLILH